MNRPSPRTVAAVIAAVATAVSLTACRPGLLPRAQSASTSPSATASGHHRHHHHATGTPAPATPAAVSSTPVATPSPASATAPACPATAGGLTVKEQAFVCAVRQALTAAGETSSATDAEIAAYGHGVCLARVQVGLDQEQEIQAALAARVQTRFAMTPTQFVKAAEDAMCPNEWATP